MIKYYGKELILDIHDCNVSLFTRKSFKVFLKELCDIIDMEREDLHFWDYEGQPEEYEVAAEHLKGISLVQFITTSNITIHSLNILKKLFLNIFSCRTFDADVAAKFAELYFEGKIVNKTEVNRL